MEHQQRVTAVFVELADTLVDDFDIIEFLQMLASRCVELLDVAAAGLMLADHRDTMHVVAASDEQARLLELFELQHDEGPCRDCQKSGKPVINAVLRAQGDRWPAFTPRALADGYLSVTAVPLRLRRRAIGALNLFRVTEDALDADQLTLAQALADSAAIGIIQQRAISQGEILTVQLQAALSSRVVIEQAKGVLAERLQVDMGDAYRMLRRHARDHDLRLTDLARQAVEGTVDVTTMLPAADTRDIDPEAEAD
jgi:GAF domain-containing protein